MITFNIINNNIVGSINGENFAVKYTKEAYEALERESQKLQEVDSFEEARDLGEKLMDLISGDVKSDIEEISPFLSYNPNTKTYHLKEKDLVSPIALPQNLVDKLKYAIDKELPVDPLLKQYTRLCRNPRVYNAVSLQNAKDVMSEFFGYTTQTTVDPDLFEKFHEEQGLSEEVAREMATVPQTPTTMEGLVVTKKVVTPLYDRQRYRYELNDDGEPTLVLRDTEGVSKEIDEDTGEVTINDPTFAEDWLFEPAMMGQRGDAFLCGNGDSEDDEGTTLGHDIRVGMRIALPEWDMVDCDPNNSCRKGLHTGNLDYVRGWEGPDNVTLLVFMDPAYWGCSPYAQSGPDAGVSRAKEVFIYGIKDRSIVNRNIYHSSTYASQNDARWAEDRKEAIENLDALVEEVQKEVEERKALLPN